MKKKNIPKLVKKIKKAEETWKHLTTEEKRELRKPG